nr:putative integron gene cassette protein [uncultured bacterium]
MRFGSRSLLVRMARSMRSSTRFTARSSICMSMLTPV